MLVSDYKISLDTLYRRYRGICWICRKFCPRDQASRDHIHPRSLGGSDELHNLALAHKRCNTKRGNGHQEVFFRHYEDVSDLKDITILTEHGLVVRVWEDKKNGGLNVLVAKKRETDQNVRTRRKAQ